MFGTLLESRGTRARRQGGVVVSILAHTAVIGAAIAGTARATRPVALPGEPPPPIIYQVLPPPPRSASPRASRPSTPSAPDRAPLPPDVAIPVHAPDVARIPMTLPPIDAPLGDALPPGGAHQIAIGRSVIGAAAPRDGEPWASGVVERVARLRTRLAPGYPRPLVSSGLEGRVLLRFIVDTTGRVESGSIEAVKSTHVLFTEAARSAIARARFEPAQVGGRPVRTLMELPFVFELEH